MPSVKVIGIFLLIMLVMTGIFYWYFEYSQGKIQVLEENNAKLTMAVQTQNETIKAQEEFSKKQNQDISALQNGLETATTDKDVLIRKLMRIDLDAHARKNPKSTEKAINKATIKIFQEIENITKNQN